MHPGKTWKMPCGPPACPFIALNPNVHLQDFDILGFSLGYELCYTNVLNMLDLAGIPVSRC
jgi:hypothetical protein